MRCLWFTIYVTKRGVELSDPLESTVIQNCVPLQTSGV
jgi:hypothetical protein